MSEDRNPAGKPANDLSIGQSFSSERLTHLVYEASLDNSLWPELILELTEQLHSAVPQGQTAAGTTEGIAEHFKRAFSISERIVSLQEKEQQLTNVIDALSVGIAMLDDDGKAILENQTAAAIRNKVALPGLSSNVSLISAESGAQMTLTEWVREANAAGEPRNLSVPGAEGDTRVAGLLLPRETATKMGFPAKAAAVLITHNPSESDALRTFAEDCLLTERETALIAALRDTRDLRAAAEATNLSYESARTYLKRVFSKTGCANQLDLFQRISSSPAAFLKRRAASNPDECKVRRLWTLKDGRTLEYFSLGPEDGKPVIYFDALSGSSIDVIGAADRYLPALQRMNVRLITICRPGGFRSTMRWVTSLRDYAPDVEELLDGLGLGTVSALSYSFGSGAALATVHELPERFERLIMSSAAYPTYKHPNWRELDVFHHLSSVIGRRWPNMLRQILPFLVRSILQNVDRYFDRHAARALAQNDIEFLNSEVARRRTKALIAERTAITMDGMVEENVLNAQGWDFHVANIETPVGIYQGTLDNVCPIGGARLLAEHLPNATLCEMDGLGHYHMATHWSALIGLAVGLVPDLDVMNPEAAKKVAAG